MRYLIAVAAVSLTACVPPSPNSVNPRPLNVVADASEYARYGPGSATLMGQAFLTTRGGDVKLAAGRAVTLDPATTYAMEWFRRFGAVASAFDVAPEDSLFQSARRTTVANAEGRFRFSGLAPGKYLLRTMVTWETGATYAGMQGGVVAALVEVGSEPSTEVVVNTVVTTATTAMLGVGFITTQQLAERRHTVLDRATGTSCQVGLLASAPTEAEAREQLLIDASRKGADGVGNISCVTHGMSFRPNCTARIVCEGDAIGWL